MKIFWLSIPLFIIWMEAYIVDKVALFQHFNTWWSFPAYFTMVVIFVVSMVWAINKIE